MESLTKLLSYLNLFFLQSYLIRFSIGSYPSNLQEVLIALAAIAFIITIISKKRLLQTIKNLKKHWLVLSLILLTVLSLLTNQFPSQIDLFRHLKFLLFGSVLSVIFLETFRSESEIKKAIRIGGIGALIFGIFSLIYNLLGYNVAPDLRLLGPLDAAVYLAFYLAPFFIFFTLEAFQNPRQRQNIIIAILLGLLLIATRSMGALGASFGLLAIFLFNKNRYTKFAFPVIALALLAAIFYTKILPTLQTDYSSLDERGQIWATALHLFREPRNILLGLGFGQFEHHYIQNVDQVIGQHPLDYKVLQPHNIILLFLSHFGILGIALLSFLLYKILTSKNTEFKLIALYFFVHGLIDTPIFKNDLLILFLIFTTLAATKLPHSKVIRSKT